MTGNHRCARRGCLEQIPRAFLMCPACWDLVPSGIRKQVYDAWGFDCGKSRPADRLAIAKAAIESVPIKIAGIVA